MSYLLGSEIRFPVHSYQQAELLDALVELWGDRLFHPERLKQFFANVQVGTRHLAMAKDEYRSLRGFGERNQAWQRISLQLLEALLPRLLETSNIAFSDVHYLVTTTVTGLAVPTLDARLINRLPLRADIRRVPLFGLGCLAGAAGVARLHDLVTQTDRCGVLLAVELCSLTLQEQDVSIANLIATGLFGDGAGGVTMAGLENKMAQTLVARGQGCRVVATRSVFFEDSEAVMGWEFSETGFSIVLNNRVPEFAQGAVSSAIHDFLEEFALSTQDIEHWIAHPGGPKVMTALEEGLKIEGALDRSRRSLAEHGNLSSVSVLCILDEVLKSGEAKPGDWGLMMAMGPGFCAEAVLLKWD